MPLADRGPLRFPDGARIALIVTINIEYWETSRTGQKEPLFAGGPATIPHALPGDDLDTANWTWREYGQRVGIWRRHGGVRSRGRRAVLHHERADHGRAAAHRRRRERARLGARAAQLGAKRACSPTTPTSPMASARSSAARSIPIEKVVGRPAKAWLSSAIRGTRHTPAFLKEFGLIAYCDYLNDDQPYLIETTHGPIVCRALFQRRQRLQHVRARQA